MEIFHCYEFLLMKKFQDDSLLWEELINETCSNPKNILESFQEKILNNDSNFMTTNRNELIRYKKISADLWFLAVALEKAPHRLMAFLNSELKQDTSTTICLPSQTVLARYLSHYNFVEMHLDSIYKYGEDSTLPKELFKCENIKVLSLKYNNLEWIPPDIGRLSKLERLHLTNNRLQNRSIPFTLTFCKYLKELYIDNNLLDALPGFLLTMPQLSTVHRHGNHNYFKATFMWYHTDVNDRVLYVYGEHHKKSKGQGQIFNPETLLFLSAKSIIASKLNFFVPGLIPSTIQDYISNIYHLFYICGNCQSAVGLDASGFKVYTFKNPYLGNTCVPFQHWACSRECAQAIEVPAHVEQVTAANQLDLEYRHYIRAIQGEQMISPTNKHCTLL